MIKILKTITLYNNITKLKSYWLLHIAVISFYLCELCILTLTVCETITEQIDLNNRIVLDYVLGFNTYFLINHLIGFMLLGLFEIILFILFLIIKIIFKKNFLIKTKFFTHNNIYNVFWTFGIYIIAIITICMTIYLTSIAYEGILWLIDK